jgi:hypothetical protein
MHCGSVGSARKAFVIFANGEAFFVQVRISCGALSSACQRRVSEVSFRGLDTYQVESELKRAQSRDSDKED